jgi:ferredoxin
MKPIVDSEKCIGCGVCEGEDSEIFKVIDGKAEVQYQNAEGEAIDFETHQDAIERAIGGCPVAAISLEGGESSTDEEGLSADPSVDPMPIEVDEDLAE